MHFRTRMALATLFLAMPTLSARADTLRVPGTYSTIQSAVNAAHPGDTVRVSPKSGADPAYHENVVITTAKLKLQGVSGATLDGTGTGHSDPGFPGPLGSSGITVTADGVAISGLTVQNFDFFPLTAGIEAHGSHAVISGNVLKSNGIGLDIEGGTTQASGNTLTANRVFGAQLAGVGVQLTQNTILGNGTGVNVTSGGNTVSGNEIASSAADGLFITTGTTDVVGSPIAATSLASNVIHNNAGNGITLDFCENVTAAQNAILSNGFGVYLLDFTTHCAFTGDLVAGNAYSGLFIEDFAGVTGCTVSYSLFIGNTLDGIQVGAFNTGNVFTINIALGNGQFDAENLTFDGAVVSNTWTHDIFGVTNPPGLGH